MNALHAVFGSSAPAIEKSSRPRSKSDAARKSSVPEALQRSKSENVLPSLDEPSSKKEPVALKQEEGDPEKDGLKPQEDDEETPLLAESKEVASQEPYPDQDPQAAKRKILVKRIFIALAESIRWVLSKLASPAIYLATCFYDEDGRFSVRAPARKAVRLSNRGTKSTAHAVGLSGSPSPKTERKSGKNLASRFESAISSSDSEGSSKGRSINTKAIKREGSPSGDENTPTRRSIRIEENARRKRQSRTSTTGPKPQTIDQTAADLKSPTSRGSSLAKSKYPSASVPPRPLIPRRQPSYSAVPLQPSNPSKRKTLVLDLDETLIHSVAKGGRMSTGHMVEVKLPAGYTNVPSGDQHPILYSVHKRPHCEEFLKKCSKWYNLVVFTASVQEYADPVIDHLEQERKYFSRRLYRQHCTFRNGAYIKDLSSVEPDLSRVCILDNSPLSYVFHEDNAVPIEGWISDPTDYDLLHLIPLFEALQYVTDVRAILSLRRGEVDASSEK